MTGYEPPVGDIEFTLEHIASYSSLTSLGSYADSDPDVAKAILNEAGKFAANVLSPLRRVGDIQGCALKDGVVRVPEGFREAYSKFISAGWNCISVNPAHGGHGMPFVLACAVMEMFTSANMAWALCPMLGQGAIEALIAHADEHLRARYIPNLVSGNWAATMNLTEPQAGSDLGAIRTRAVPQDDGTYLISGQKIFITWGDHDLTENIIHLVLARLPNALPGTKGISLFVVPKFLIADDGSFGRRNDLRVVSVENKLGLHGSPTCVMSFGDSDQCTGYLVGKKNEGMRFMFTMMNHSRLNVGLQGVGQAELAYQMAYRYASERVQGMPIGMDRDDRTPIIFHPDVRRMLLTMKAQTEAARALVYLNASAMDLAKHAPSEKERVRQQGLADLLTPLSKSYASDIGVEVASAAIQVHGGMGFIEETGVAQILRDIRIAPIYEGTNGIQALDLVGRKLTQDDGIHMRALLTTMKAASTTLGRDGDLGAIRRVLEAALCALDDATEWMLDAGKRNPLVMASGATHYQRLFASTVSAWLLATGAKKATRLIAEGTEDEEPLNNRIRVARFYCEAILRPDIALLGPIKDASVNLCSILREEMIRL